MTMHHSRRASFCLQPEALESRRLLSAGLVIKPTFDSSVTRDPSAAVIEKTINSAIQVYENLIKDPVTVTVKFEETRDGLGTNDSNVYSESYSDYRTALAKHAASADDATALAHLPASTLNPVNQSSQIVLTGPIARALGFHDSPDSGDFDSVIALNTHDMNLSRSGAQDPNKYDMLGTVEHELDEVLGLGSSLDDVAAGFASPSDPTYPLDLFRYDARGHRSYTANPNAVDYFSINGTTHLERFNQNSDGDLGDWFNDGSLTPRVQDAFGTPGNIQDLAAPEKTALDVIGYTFFPPVKPAPKPQITGFTLVDSSTAKLLGQLHDGGVVSLSKLKTSRLDVDVLANSDTASITFKLNGKSIGIDGTSPFTILGAEHAKPGSSLAVGKYTLIVQPFNKANGTGIAGASQTIHFTITK